MIELNRILLPTDLGECSEAAAAQARELAAMFRAEIHVLHVLQEPIPLVPEPMALSGLIDIKALRAATQSAFDKWTAEHFPKDGSIVSQMISGTDFVEILRYAREHFIDLIVIGSHGSTGLQHVLLGSVAERVIRKSPCPVLTVRSQPAADS